MNIVAVCYMTNTWLVYECVCVCACGRTHIHIYQLTSRRTLLPGHSDFILWGRGRGGNFECLQICCIAYLRMAPYRLLLNSIQKR